MSEQSHVVAAIGGKPVDIQRFIDAVQSAGIEDEDELIPSFKSIRLYEDLSIFAFYRHSCDWFSASETTWESLCELADSLKLSWVFYRVSYYCQDKDWNDNGSAKYFDKRMLELFEIQQPIRFKHPNLQDLDQ